MTNEQEKQDLVEILKSGINKYSIHLTGYGGEIVVGEITPAQYQYWRERDLDELINDWDDDLAIDKDLKIFQHGVWHDCDSIAHETGVEFSNLCYVTVYDQNDNEVWQSSLGTAALEEAGLDPEGFNYDEMRVRHDSTAAHAFLAQSIEKGTFFTGEFETFGRFDPRKLSFSTIDIEGWDLVNGVSYASQIIDDTGGYDTRGKGMELKVFEVER
jgi:hypothetical protein